REALGSSGWRVCTASNPEEALRLLRAGAPFDALVVDATAEGGVEALRRYRAGGGRIPAVAVGREGLSGVNECVPAEWESGELASAIRKAVLAARHLPANEARMENRALAPEVDA